MYKIAVIFESCPYDRKGLFNAIHERIKALKEVGSCQITAFCIHSRDNRFTRAVRHTPKVPFEEYHTVDGVKYNLLWYQFSIIDHLTVWKLNERPLFFDSFMSKKLPLLKEYDLILSHSFTGSLFAYEAKKQYGVPYFANWHGSDVHTHPWKNKLMLKFTTEIMKEAEKNFFVSQALMNISDMIVKDVDKSVIYNGVSDIFFRYPDEERYGLRKNAGVSNDVKVLAFAGMLVHVKNVLQLQPIFAEVDRRFKGEVVFWILGDGKLRSQVERTFEGSGLNMKFWGNVKAEKMPEMMNCMDVLVLPSLNEGLPLVCAEALSCGANVVGSAVGGIPEVIGKENTVPLGDGFIDGMVCRIVSFLEEPRLQTLPDALSWKKSAMKEWSAIVEVLETKNI